VADKKQQAKGGDISWRRGGKEEGQRGKLALKRSGIFFHFKH